MLFQVIRPREAYNLGWSKTTFAKDDYWYLDSNHQLIPYVMLKYPNGECYLLYGNGNLEHYGHYDEHDIQHSIDENVWYISEPTNQFHFNTKPQNEDT